MPQYTPMIQQYLKIKAQYQDAFLFFRLGDFYEMFFEDATRAAQELEITLTSREGGKGKLPMCGVPHHSAENYIKTLVERGYKVAVCEQVEDPKQAIGVVKREVVQLITPGTVMEGKMLEEKENNFLAALSSFKDGTYVVAYNDLSTGESSVAFLPDGWDAVIGELYNRPVREIVISDSFEEAQEQSLIDRLSVTLSYEEETTIPSEHKDLLKEISQDKLKVGFGRLYNYLQRTQKRALDHLQPVQLIELNHYMKLDMYSKRNLELMETIRKKGKHGSLLWVLDKTVTAMGSRLLKKWLERPLLSREKISERYNQVEGYVSQFFERESLRDALKSVYDLERLAGRVAFGNVNARDLIQLKHSLSKIPEIKTILTEFEMVEIRQHSERLDPLDDLYKLLDESIANDPPLSMKDGGIISDGYHEQLDQYRDAAKNGKQWIAELERTERQETGIKSLKVGYNRVFGYYIEVTKANLHLLPEGKYERKQTLTNAERYITPELKEKESLILEAQDKSVELEHDLFVNLREKVKTYIPQLQKLAEQISTIDVLQGFATVSEANQFIRPRLIEERRVNIVEARHPVVEQVMKNETFVPNDITMNDDIDVLLITGPNMSGKSTYMRQFALITIMAQVGCFVPCAEAELPVFDQIFTRIGAADDLVAGQSTFMVEMLEANHALTKATENSLILLDEIGRGTSTYDGMALAQAIVEYIHEQIHAKTLFSTHYHELTALEDSLEKLQNVHVRAEEHEGNVVFLHKIQPGAADESYGIHVAKLAHLPEPLIKRATNILEMLEMKDKTSKKEILPKEEGQLSFFAAEKNKKQQNSAINNEVKLNSKEQSIISSLETLDLLEMTPLDAMNKLYQLQKLLK